MSLLSFCCSHLEFSLLRDLLTQCSGVNSSVAFLLPLFPPLRLTLLSLSSCEQTDWKQYFLHFPTVLALCETPVPGSLRAALPQFAACLALPSLQAVHVFPAGSHPCSEPSAAPSDAGTGPPHTPDGATCCSCQGLRRPARYSRHKSKALHFRECLHGEELLPDSLLKDA